MGRVTFGAIGGATTHAIENHFADRPLTEGIGYAATVGGLGGAATGKLVQLSGGGWQAQTAWQLEMYAVGREVQQLNPSNQQRHDARQ